MESGHRFDAQTLHSFIQAVFRQMGSEEQEAKLVADHLIAANLAGHDSHGIGMIPSYVRSWSQGHLQINHHAKIVKEAGAAVTLDGDRAFGQVAARGRLYARRRGFCQMRWRWWRNQATAGNYLYEGKPH
ncbi:Ldh family oxidoreductase, partial [Escherichia coli]|uniref:Ldh family oxidoreductase n=1 Tax=Escherichia coli TaxID=562 RepID=UPI00207BF788